MPQIIKYHCRPERKLTNHAVIEGEGKGLLPRFMELIQCQSCGVMGIARLDRETAYNAEI